MIDEKTNDMNLLNNIQSGLEIKNAKEQLEADIKEGKENPANTLLLQESINRFKNSKDVTDVFVNPYFTPISITEKLNELLKNNFDKSGNTRVYQTASGQYGVINETELIQRGQLAEVQKLINNYLYTDPSIQRQAYANAKYMYRSVSDEDLKKEVSTQFDEENAVLEKELKDRQQYLSLIPEEKRDTDPNAMSLKKI